MVCFQIPVFLCGNVLSNIFLGNYLVKKTDSSIARACDRLLPTDCTCQGIDCASFRVEDVMVIEIVTGDVTSDFGDLCK